jgi:leucyl-tRNA synthetase
MEFNTMPGWAGSSWYFLRYLDPHCEEGLASKEAMSYWKNVDLYIGGNEHATGHLLYARFWTKFLFDLGLIPFDEPFKKLINQGMILGRSSYVYRLKSSNTFVSYGLKDEHDCFPVHVDIALVDNDLLDLEGFKKWLPEYADAAFVLESNGTYVCGHEVEKMSKSKFNVQTPDELIDKYGADTLRMYEMFLGPIEQSKPWDTKGITGVHGFLKKFWRLYHSEGTFTLSEENPTAEEWRILHKTIKKVREDIDRFSLNTVVSTLMIAVNELTEVKCNKRKILKDLNLLLAPYAPYITAEIWEKMFGQTTLINDAKFPEFDASYLVESTFSYPVSFNGKMRFLVELDLSMEIKDIEQVIRGMEETQKLLDGKEPKKFIIVPGKIVNVVI